MASDDKKSKTTPAPKKESPAKDLPAKELASKDKAAPEAVPAKPESSETPSSSYSRGEGQKPVSQAYKDNWNAIFAKKKKKKR